jgi:aerobic carbon-monoxide dehydrogenase medium subunit
MRYLEPTTVDEALGALAEHGESAKVIAGGQSLLIMMRERLVDPEVLIGLNAIGELRSLKTNGEAVIGAMVRHVDVEKSADVAHGWPLVSAAEAAVSTLQVRNRGTLCGSVAHAFPTADPPGALVASDARVRLVSAARGEREVAAEDFFVGLLETAAEPDELVRAVVLPAQPPGARTAYMKFAIRPLDFAIVGVAVRVVLASDGTISDARIGLNGAANRCLRAAEAEAVLRGSQPSDELVRRAGDAAAAQSQPLADVDGNEDYKRHVVGVYTRRALEKALA